jgi:hypothetical protein
MIVNRDGKRKRKRTNEEKRQKKGNERRNAKLKI